MKILFLSENKAQASNGWGRYTLDLRHALIKEGHDVATIGEVIEENLSGKSLSSPTSYLCPPVAFFMPFRFLSDVFMVRAAINLYSPDIIHVTMEPYSLLLPFLSLRHIPVIITVHGTYAYIPNVVFPILRPFYRYIFLKALSVTRGIVAISHYTKAYLLRNITSGNLKENAEKISVIHNGIDISWTSFLEHPGDKGDKKIILTVGAVKRRKGIKESLRALAYFKEKYGIPFTYRIVGSYDSESAYFKELYFDIEKFNMKDNVVFLGKVSDEELKQQYKEADLFLMLPIDDSNRFEGFGLVYLEANAYGVPVIGSKNAGSAEAIQDGVSGYLVDPTNASEAAEKVHRVLSQKVISRHECRMWAEKHSIEKMAREYTRLYVRAVELSNEKILDDGLIFSMYKEFKYLIKKSVFFIEEYLGFFIGMLGRMVPWAGDALFKMTVLCARHLPDYAYLSVFPFIDEMGRVIYDKHNTHWVNTQLLNGSLMRVDISEKTQRQIYMNKIFEAGLARYLVATLKLGDTFIDVGANVGYFTILSAKAVGPNGRVISIEPELRNIETLKSNIQLNDYQNVTVCECAVGKEESVQVLNINPLNRGGNSLIPFTEYKSGRERNSPKEIIKKYDQNELFQDVKVCMLDNFVKENNLDTIAFIKIDVEGFEYEVLMGAKDLIQSRKATRIICEISNKNSKDDILKLFHESGYTPYSLSFDGKLIPLGKDNRNHPRDILFCVE